MEASFSAILAESNFNWLEIIKNLIIYIVSPISIIGSGIFIIKLTYKLGKISEKFDTVCKTVEDHTKTNSNVGSSIQKIEKSLVNIQTVMMSKLSIESDLLKTQSPISLTEKGYSIVEESGFPSLYENNKKLFIKLLKAKKPSDEADLDKFAEIVMFELNDKKILDQLEVGAYQCGLPLALLLKVCAVYLRDVAKQDIFKKI